MERVLSRKFQQKIKNLASPLIDHFGLSEFYHYRLSESGHYVNVGLNAESEEFYFSDPSHLFITPYFRHPKYYNNGVSYIQAIEDEKYAKLVNFIGSQFKCTWSLQIMRKTKERIDAYGFGLNSSNLRQHLTFYRALPILNRFIDHFNEKIAPYEHILEDTQVDVASILGSKFFEPPVPIMLDPVSCVPLLKEMGLTPTSSLTLKEIDVIKHLLNGSSASLIADYLCLSPRTVKHHIERIKDKFNCSTKANLFKVLRHLETMGYFT